MTDTLFIPGKVPNKANRYEIRVHRGFWRAIQPIVRQFQALVGQGRRTRLYWIAPVLAVYVIEHDQAWRAKCS